MICKQLLLHRWLKLGSLASRSKMWDAEMAININRMHDAHMSVFKINGIYALGLAYL